MTKKNQTQNQYQDSDDDDNNLIAYALHSLMTGENLDKIERMLSPPVPKINREVAVFQCQRLRLLLNKLDAPPALYSRSTELFSLTKKSVLVDHFKACLRRAVGTPKVNIGVLKGLIDLMEMIRERRSEQSIVWALDPDDGDMNQKEAGSFFEKFGMSAQQLENMLTRRWSMRFWCRSTTHERLAKAWENTFYELERHVPVPGRAK